MGSTCLIRVWCPTDGADAEQLLTSAVGFVDGLERLWSRFRIDSEVSRVNRHAGVAVPVSAPTLDLVALAVAAWSQTGGRYDPTVGDAVIAAGYDRTFSELSIDRSPSPRQPAGRSTTRRPSIVPGCSGVVVDHASGTITVPAGVRLDFGGIGKGRAADLTASLLLESGALGALVDLGGDVRVIGVAPEADQWVITVEDPDAPETALVGVGLAGTGGGGSSPALGGGAVATSTTLRRCWPGPDGPAHHLIDPSTGRPSTSDVVMATVVAADATWAEVFAKAALLAGAQEGAELISAAGLAGLLVVRDGDHRRVETAGDLANYLVDLDGACGVDADGRTAEPSPTASTNRSADHREALT